LFLKLELKKIVGSEDADLARRVEPRSLNALFGGINRENSIITPSNKSLSRRMLSYFFSGRLQKINTVDDVRAIEGTNGKKQLYLTKPASFHPVFLLNSEPIREFVCVLGSEFTPMKYGKVIQKVKSRGFDLLNLCMTNLTNISALARSDEEFKAFVASEGLTELCKENRQNLVLHFSGSCINSLRDCLLRTVIDYNPFF